MLLTQNRTTTAHRIIFIAGIALLFATSLATTAIADEYHYRNSLIGDRAAGLGSAYTAVSDDPSGLFYNPAGIVYASGANMSASMNSYQQTTLTYEDVLGNQYDWSRNSSTLLPNFFGIIQPLDKGIFGFSYAVPNSIKEDQDQIFPNITASIDRFIINFNNEDTTYNFGPSYAIEINDKLSLGATLYMHIRQQQRTSNILLEYGSGARFWSNEYYELEETGFKPVLGLMWTPKERISIGATLSQINITDSETTRHETCEGASTIVYDASSFCQSSQIKHRVRIDTTKSDQPLNLNIGVAYFHSKDLMLSGDISYYSSIDSTTDPKESVINLAIGAEYYINPRMVLRGGFYTDMANTPDLTTNVTAYNQSEHIDLYGISASLGHFTRSSSLSFGLSYAMGTGKAQMISGDSTLQDATLESLTIYISASNSI